MARRRTITIVFGEDLTGEWHADHWNGIRGVLEIGHPDGRFHPRSDEGRKDKPAAGDVAELRGGAVTIAEAADAFLSSPRTASPNTRRAYANVIDRTASSVSCPGAALS